MTEPIEGAKFVCHECGCLSVVPLNDWSRRCDNETCPTGLILAQLPQGLKYVWVKGEKARVGRVPENQRFLTCDCCHTDHYIDKVAVKQINNQDVYGSYPTRDYIRKQDEELYILRRSLELPQDECSRAVAEEQLLHADTKYQMVLLNAKLEETSMAMLRANDRSAHFERETQRLQGVIEGLKTSMEQMAVRQKKEKMRHEEEKERQRKEADKRVETMEKDNRKQTEVLLEQTAALSKAKKDLEQIEEQRQKLEEEAVQAKALLEKKDQQHQDALKKLQEAVAVQRALLDKCVTEHASSAAAFLAKINKLEAEKKNAEEEVVGLRGLHETKEKAVSSLKLLLSERTAILGKVNMELEHAKDQKTKAEEKGLQMKALLAAKNEEHKEFMKKLQEQQEVINIKTSEFESQEQVLAERCAALAKVNEEMYHLKQQKTQLEQEAVHSKGLREKKEKEHQELLKELQEHKGNAVDAEKKASETQDEVLAERSAAMAKVNEDMDHLKQQKIQLEEEAVQSKDLLEKKDREHQELLKELQEHKEKVIDAEKKAEAQDKVLAERCAALAKVNEEMDHLKQQKAQLEQEAVQSKDLLEKKDVEHQELLKEFQKHKEKAIDAVKKASETQDEVLAERSTAMAKVNEEMDHLKQQKIQLEEEAVQSKDLLEKKEKEHQELLKELQEHKEKASETLDKVLAEHSAAMAKVNEEMYHLKQQKTQLEQEAVQSKGLLEKKDKEHQELLSDLQEHKEKTVDAEKKASETQDKVFAEHSAALTKVNEELDHLKQQKAQLEQGAVQSKDLLEKKEKEHQELLKELEEHKEKAITDGCRQNLIAEQTAIPTELKDHLKEQKKELEKELSQTRGLLKEKKAQCGDHSRELMEQKEAVVAKAKTLESLEMVLHERSAELATTKKEKEEAMAVLRKKLEETRRLQKAANEAYAVVETLRKKGLSVRDDEGGDLVEKLGRLCGGVQKTEGKVSERPSAIPENNKRKRESALDDMKPFKKRKEEEVEKETKPPVPLHKPSPGTSLSSATPVKPKRISSLSAESFRAESLEVEWRNLMEIAEVIDPFLGKQEEPDNGYEQSLHRGGRPS